MALDEDEDAGLTRLTLRVEGIGPEHRRWSLWVVPTGGASRAVDRDTTDDRGRAGMDT